MLKFIYRQISHFWHTKKATLMEEIMGKVRAAFFVIGFFIGFGLCATYTYLQQKNTNPPAVILDFSLQAEKSADPLPRKITITPPPIANKDPLYWKWQEIDTANIYFPADFMWGAAISAHQTEGNCVNDWTTWEAAKKLTPTETACNHWNDYKKDIQLLKKAGFTSFRFSIEWSKIEPNPESYDTAALAHYEEVCKELVKEGIKPIVTLHYYTNPTWFTTLGGFEKEENGKYFINFCTKVFEKLHPYVHLWITFNAPTSYVARAYHAQLAPPGKSDTQLMQDVLKNMLDLHVQVYQKLKKLPGGSSARIGLCHNIYQVEPKHFWDKAGCSTAYTLFNNNIYTFFKTGHFSVSVPFKAKVKHFNAKAPKSLDFIGLNYYSHGLMTNFTVDAHPNEVTTQTKIYTIYPEGFYRALEELTTELAQPLNIPIYVTENGIATKNEEHRELFFKQYLYALSYALHQGFPIKGYMVWSLLDNYDWGSYDNQFGIYAVDFKTHKRSEQPRAGAQYLLNVIRNAKQSAVTMAVKDITQPKKSTPSKKEQKLSGQKAKRPARKKS